MRRPHWTFLLAAAVFGLVPLSAFAVAPFQAQEISTLNITAGSAGGLVELNNAGLVITNIGGCSYNPYGATSAIPGFTGIVAAVQDGLDGGSWNGISGITGINAATAPHTYGIAFNYLTSPALKGLQGTNWGGVQFTDSDLTTNGGSGDLLIRETYVGDAVLNGYVDLANDYNIWAANYGTVVGGTAGIATTGGVGIAAGDYASWSFLTGNIVDLANDYNLWAATYGNPGLGPNYTNGGPPAGPIVAGGVQAVPEPSSLLLLLGAALVGLLCIATNKITSWTFLRKGLAMRRFRVGTIVACLIAGLSATAKAELGLLSAAGDRLD